MRNSDIATLTLNEASPRAEAHLNKAWDDLRLHRKYTRNGINPGPEAKGEMWRRSLSPINRHFVIFGVLAHFEHVQRQGRVRHREENGALAWHA